MRRNLTGIAIVCVLMLVFVVMVDQPVASSSLQGRKFVATASYVNNAVSQVFRTLSVFYYALFASSIDASDQAAPTVISVPVEVEESEVAEVTERELEDGFVLSVDERKAHINLGVGDGVQRGMLLEIYRPKGLYDAMSDVRYPIGGSLGYGLVVEVHEFTSAMYLSHFEIKMVDSGKDGGNVKLAVEVHDRVRRPPMLEKEIIEILAEQIVTENAKILSVDGNMFLMTSFDRVSVGNAITLIKTPKEIIHPVTGELVVLGDEKRADAIVADIKGKTILLSVEPNASGHFIVGDIVRITKR